jgi:hypothetical protein
MDTNASFLVVARWVFGGSALACAVVLFAVPAHSQRTDFRDKNGNPKGYVQQEGDRSVLRDNSGNPHGYWQQEGSSLVHRDSSGNLIGRQQVK